MSVTIIEVSDSFTSRDFAEESIGWKRFNPFDRRSATLAGIAISVALPSGICGFADSFYVSFFLFPFPSFFSLAEIPSRRRILAIIPTGRSSFSASPSRILLNSSSRRSERGLGYFRPGCLPMVRNVAQIILLDPMYY